MSSKSLMFTFFVNTFLPCDLSLFLPPSFLPSLPSLSFSLPSSLPPLSLPPSVFEPVSLLPPSLSDYRSQTLPTRGRLARQLSDANRTLSRDSLTYEGAAMTSLTYEGATMTSLPEARQPQADWTPKSGRTAAQREAKLHPVKQAMPAGHDETNSGTGTGRPLTPSGSHQSSIHGTNSRPLTPGAGSRPLNLGTSSRPSIPAGVRRPSPGNDNSRPLTPGAGIRPLNPGTSSRPSIPAGVRRPSPGNDMNPYMY